MTLRMAAGQQKKRLTSSNVYEQYRGKKKKKVDSSDYILNLRSHIYLEWDGRQKRAVAKREQIGITWMDMAPFVDSVSQLRSGLADVLPVPQEIFSLENLTEVLSYEVWATCLSEPERKLLTQFLPSGTSAEQVVQSLLTGENHHFGNPFLKWSALLCSGNLHPDNAVCMEKQHKADKMAYYLELNKYYDDMLEVLKKWKEIWMSCEDPEKLSKAFTKPKQGSLLISAGRAKVDSFPKKEMPHKSCIQYSDSAKYMSYIKISRKQHDLVKSMKHSGDGIQSKSLSHVLGDIKSFNVQPYEALEAEQNKRLHEHWLLMASKDLAMAFEDRGKRKLQREQWSKSLEQELVEKIKLLNNKDMVMKKFEKSPQENLEDGELEHHSVTSLPDQEEDDSSADSMHDHLERIPSLNSHQEISSVGSDEAAVAQDTPEGIDNYCGRTILAEDVMDQEVDGEAMLKPSDNFCRRTDPADDVMEQEPVDQHMLKSANDFFGRADLAADIMELKAPMSSSKELWRAVGTQDSYYNASPESHGYSSVDFSLRQPPAMRERRTSAINLKSDILKQHDGESVAPSICLENGASLFCSYASNDRNELLPAYSKASEILSSYPHDLNSLKQPGLQFLVANGSLSESGHFSHPFQDQQRFLEQRQLREKELYVNHMMNENMHPSDHYPRQGNFDQQNLVAMQSSVDSGLVRHNWFPGDYRAANGWPQSSHQLSNNGGKCLGDGSSADGSLFSVLSACKMMLPRSQYEITRSEQFMHARNFVVGGTSTDDNIYAYPPSQLTGSSSHDAATAPPSMKVNNVSWLNFPQQNHGLHDISGKQFQRPWNQ